MKKGRKILAITGAATISFVGGHAYATGNLMSPETHDPQRPAGLSYPQTVKPIERAMPAIQACLRKTPAMASVNLVLDIGPTGAVRTATFAPRVDEKAEWAACVKAVGLGITFPKSDGDTEVAVPLKLLPPPAPARK